MRLGTRSPKDPKSFIPGPPGKLRHLHPWRFSPSGTGQATRSAPTQTSLPKKTSGPKLPGVMKASRSPDPKDLLALYLDATHPSTRTASCHVRGGERVPLASTGPGLSCPCYRNGLSLERLQRQRLLRKWSPQQRLQEEGIGRAYSAPERAQARPGSGTLCTLGSVGPATLSATNRPPFPFPSCSAPDAKGSAADPRGARPLQAPRFPKGSVASRRVPRAARLSACRILCHRCHAQA